MSYFASKKLLEITRFTRLNLYWCAYLIDKDSFNSYHFFFTPYITKEKKRGEKQKKMTKKNLYGKIPPGSASSAIGQYVEKSLQFYMDRSSWLRSHQLLSAVKSEAAFIH